MDALEDVAPALEQAGPRRSGSQRSAPYNFIDDGRQPRIIHFEHSGNNDPCFDLGVIASEAESDDDLRAVLCGSYFGEVTPQPPARMKLQAVIANAGWSLYRANPSQGDPDPGFWEGSTTYRTEVLEAMDSAELPDLVRAGTG